MTTYTIEPQTEITPPGETKPRWVRCSESIATRWAIMADATQIAVASSRTTADRLVASLLWYQNPHAAPSMTLTIPDPLERLEPALRTWLVDEMGMEPELVGGGDHLLRHECHTGGYLWLTNSDGAGMPSAGDWMVGAYLPPVGDVSADVSECAWEARSTDDQMTLRQAVAMGCSFLAEAEAAPVPQVAEKAVYISRREEAAVLAALRLLEVRVREDSLGQEFEAIMANAGPPLTAPQIELLADALGNDTYLAVTTVAPEGR